MGHPLQRVLATMATTTSYGTWLPGDLRGYVDRGVILPGNPELLERSKRLMKARPVYFTMHEQDALFEALKLAANEFQYGLVAVSIESWHAHWLIDHAFDSVDVMVGRLKTRMRQALSAPPFQRHRIWTEGYDHRLCFDQQSVTNRRNYIRRHRGWRPLPYEVDSPKECDLEIQ